MNCCITVGVISGVAGALLGYFVPKMLAKKSSAPYNSKRGAKGRVSAGKGGNREKPHAPPADGSIEIYVGNLSYELTEEKLRKEFEAFGKVNSARIITNRFNGKSKGFGFVHMPNKAEVDAALAVLSDKEILGRKIKCNVAKTMS